MGKAENTVEKYLHQQVTKIGGTTRKFTSPGHVGVADRLCFLPYGRLYIVEVKSDTGSESGPQQRERERMISLGFRSVVVYGKSGVDDLLKEMTCSNL